jgi:polygalacturonase
MKYSIVLTMLAFAATQASAQNANEILQQIRPPHFKHTVYNIVTMGAISDGKTNCKPVLDSAITLCSIGGGGQVLIPKGEFFIAGPIVLKSHVNLHFDIDAVLVFSANEKDYLPAVLCRIPSNAA